MRPSDDSRWQGASGMRHKTFFRVHCPVPGPSRSDPPGVLPGKVDKICGGHGQGETPGPIPNPEAKALHGDGTAPERVWESSAPPLSMLGVPVERKAPGTLFCFAGLPAGARTPGFPGERSEEAFGLQSACVSYVKALRLVLWQELRCMTLQRRRVCLPRRSPSPSGIPTK